MSGLDFSESFSQLLVIDPIQGIGRDLKGGSFVSLVGNTDDGDLPDLEMPNHPGDFMPTVEVRLFNNGAGISTVNSTDGAPIAGGSLYSVDTDGGFVVFQSHPLKSVGWFVVGSSAGGGGGGLPETPLAIIHGGTGATTSSAARTNLGVPSSNQVMLLTGANPMTGPMDLGNQLINNVADAVSPGDAVSQNYADSNYLKLAGGTMSGNVNIASHTLNGLTDPGDGTAAVPLSYLQSNYLPSDGSGQMTGTLLMGGNFINQVLDPVSAQGAATKNYCDTNFPLASTVILKTGAVAFTGDQSMGTNKLTNVGTPSASTDAATKGYVDGLIPSTPISVLNGGTGSTTASGARSNLSAASSGANSDITSITGLTTMLAVNQGGTAASTASGARSNLGAAASGANSDITSITGLTTMLALTQGGTGANSASAARTNLGVPATTAVMLLDGTQAMTANMDLGSHRITNVSDPTGAQDAVTKAYLSANASIAVTKVKSADQSFTSTTLADDSELSITGLDSSKRYKIDGWVDFSDDTSGGSDMKFTLDGDSNTGITFNLAGGNWNTSDVFVISSEVQGATALSVGAINTNRCIHIKGAQLAGATSIKLRFACSAGTGPTRIRAGSSLTATLAS